MKSLLILILFITPQFTHAQYNQEIKRNVETDSIKALSYYDKAIDKIISDDNQGALQYLNKAIDLSPKNAEYYYTRA